MYSLTFLTSPFNDVSPTAEHGVIADDVKLSNAKAIAVRNSIHAAWGYFPVNPMPTYALIFRG